MAEYYIDLIDDENFFILTSISTNRHQNIYRNLINGEKLFILTTISTNRHAYFGWILTLEKYLKQYNLDDILC